MPRQAFSTPPAGNRSANVARPSLHSGGAARAAFPQMTPLNKVSPTSAANAVAEETPSGGLISRLLHTASSASFVAGAGYALGVQYGHKIGVESGNLDGEDVLNNVSESAGVQLSADYVRYGAQLRLRSEAKNVDGAQKAATSERIEKIRGVLPLLGVGEDPQRIRDVFALRQEGSSRAAALLSPERAGESVQASAARLAEVGTGSSVLNEALLAAELDGSDNVESMPSPAKRGRNE